MTAVVSPPTTVAEPGLTVEGEMVLSCGVIGLMEGDYIARTWMINEGGDLVLVGASNGAQHPIMSFTVFNGDRRRVRNAITTACRVMLDVESRPQRMLRAYSGFG